WLKLPARTCVELSAPAQLSVRLAVSSGQEGAGELPEDPSFSGRADFARCMSSAIELWLRRQGLPARVMIADGVSPDVTQVMGRLSLVTEEKLLLIPLETVGTHWLDA